MGSRGGGEREREREREKWCCKGRGGQMGNSLLLCVRDDWLLLFFVFCFVLLYGQSPTKIRSVLNVTQRFKKKKCLILLFVVPFRVS